VVAVNEGAAAVVHTEDEDGLATFEGTRSESRPEVGRNHSTLKRSVHDLQRSGLGKGGVDLIWYDVCLSKLCMLCCSTVIIFNPIS
jgi:hypothetical protein